MSKYVKRLLTDHLRVQWDDVEAAVLVSVAGMTANANVSLRRELRAKDMHMMVVKNSLARRATEGTALAPAFTELNIPIAVVWGGEDIVSVAKEVVRLSKVNEYSPFAPAGGVMDGDALSAEAIIAVSKWPSRSEQLSLLVGQILSPGANLSAALLGPGAALASQIKQKGEEEEEPASS